MKKLLFIAIAACVFLGTNVQAYEWEDETIYYGGPYAEYTSENQYNCEIGGQCYDYLVVPREREIDIDEPFVVDTWIEGECGPYECGDVYQRSNSVSTSFAVAPETVREVHQYYYTQSSAPQTQYVYYPYPVQNTQSVPQYTSQYYTDQVATHVAPQTTRLSTVSNQQLTAQTMDFPVVETPSIASELRRAGSSMREMGTFVVAKDQGTQIPRVLEKTVCNVCGTRTRSQQYAVKTSYAQVAVAPVVHAGRTTVRLADVPYTGGGSGVESLIFLGILTSIAYAGARTMQIV